jgi:hypothetical protein
VGKVVSANRLRLLRVISVELFVIKNYGCWRLVLQQHECLPQTTQSGQLLYIRRQVVLLARYYSPSKPLNNAAECGVKWQISLWVLSLTNTASLCLIFFRCDVGELYHRQFRTTQTMQLTNL